MSVQLRRRVAASLVIPGVLVAYASAAPTTSFAEDDGTQPPAAVSPPVADCTPVEPFNVVDFPDGGKSYQYLIGGVLTEAPVPPDGFRPELADDFDLARYGFPPRPADPDDLVDWEADMRAYEFTPTPEMCSSDEVHDIFLPGPDDGLDPRPIPGIVNRTSGNWAGWEARPSGDNRYVAVSGEFDVPQRDPDGCEASRMSNWVGIGGATTRGDGSAGLLQTGTARPPAGAPYAWWEYVGVDSNGNSIGVSEKVITSLDINVGDHVHTSLFYQTSDDQANFIVQNETTGHSQSIQRTIAQKFYQGTSAEWITERPQVGGDLAALQNFVKVNWTAAKVQNQSGNWVYLSDTGTQVRDRMTRRTSAGDLHTLANPGAVSGDLGGAFTTDWNRCL